MDIRLPNITATTEKEQIEQIKSYLYQLARDLEWMLSNIEGGTGSSGDVTNIIRAIKPILAEASEITGAYYERMRPSLEKDFCTKEEYKKTEREVGELNKKVSRNEKAIGRLSNLFHSVGYLSGRELHILGAWSPQSIFLFGGKIYGTICIDSTGTATFSGSEGVSSVSYSEGIITVVFSSDINSEFSAISALPVEII